MLFFLDASSLVKLYIHETGSETMRALFQRPDTAGSFFTSDHVALEVLVTLGRNLIRADRKKRRAFLGAVERFVSDRSRYLNVVTVESGVVAAADAIAVAYADSGAGTLDLLHLAAADHIQRTFSDEPLVFVVADRKLRSLARRAGFLIFDPENDGVESLPAPDLGI
jgi:predicted nucleic acid-binding protein